MGRESVIYKRNFSEISIRRKLAWNDIDLDNVRKIIELSLYEDLGKNNARTHMMVIYQQNIQTLREQEWWDCAQGNQ